MFALHCFVLFSFRILSKSRSTHEQQFSEELLWLDAALNLLITLKVTPLLSDIDVERSC